MSSKISALTVGSPALTTDLIPIDRAGSNFSLLASDIAALAGSGIGSAGQGGFWGPGLAWDALTVAKIALGGIQIGPTANKVYVMQFVLNNSYTIRKVSWTATNNLVSNSGTCGIYLPNGNKLLDGGLFNTLTSPAVQTNTITAVVLPAGVYYFAQSTTSTSAGTFLGIQANTGDASNVQKIYQANSVRMGVAANSTSGGVLPATLGTITASTFDAVSVQGIGTPFFEP